MSAVTARRFTQPASSGHCVQAECWAEEGGGTARGDAWGGWQDATSAPPKLNRYHHFIVRHERSIRSHARSLRCDVDWDGSRGDGTIELTELLRPRLTLRSGREYSPSHSRRA